MLRGVQTNSQGEISLLTSLRTSRQCNKRGEKGLNNIPLSLLYPQLTRETPSSSRMQTRIWTRVRRIIRALAQQIRPELYLEAARTLASSRAIYNYQLWRSLSSQSQTVRLIRARYHPRRTTRRWSVLVSRAICLEASNIISHKSMGTKPARNFHPRTKPTSN